MAIYLYANDILTHGGQTTVEGFGQEIEKAASTIAGIKDLRVIVGYHGTEPSGNFDRAFDDIEQEVCRQIGLKFPNAKLEWFLSKGMDDEEIRQACEAGSVFFTWCDSDARVARVVDLGAGQPL